MSNAPETSAARRPLPTVEVREKDRSAHALCEELLATPSFTAAVESWRAEFMPNGTEDLDAAHERGAQQVRSSNTAVPLPEPAPPWADSHNCG